ncbi:MAG: hypothetical protein FJ279_38365, partial [Planctomycetes bacterium]|nr:hypothetical protein [Planctomycetota bacterium]
EPGNYSYDRSAWRAYVLSTRGHNTVMVDGQEQHRRAMRDTFLAKSALPNRWLTRADFDFAEGTYADGYGPKNDRTVTHRRQVLFVKPDYWIVVDVLEPSDQAEHRYEALFHLDAESVSIEPAEAPGAEKPVPKLGTGFWIATCDPGKGNLALVSLAPGMAAEIVKGQERPVVQGWLPTGRHNELRPIPTVALTKRGAGRTVMAYALVPFGPEARCPVTSRIISELANSEILVQERSRGDVAAATLRFGPDREDLIVINPPVADAPSRSVSAGGLTTDAEIAVLSRGAQGEALRTLLIGASVGIGR